MSAIAVNFQAQGVSRIMEAFASIEKRAVQFQTKAIRSQQLLTTATERETAKREKAQARSEDRAAKDAERAAKHVERIKERHFRDEQRRRDKDDREHQRSLERQTKAFERESARMGNIARRSADRRIQEETRAAKAAEQAQRQAGKAVSGRIGGATRGVLGTVGAIAGGALALGGGFSTVDAVQTLIANKGRAADIAIASGGELNKQDILSRASNTASAYGTSTEKALAATDRVYAKAGNAKLALDMMPKVLALATATGGDAGEIGEVAGQIFNADKSLSAGDVDSVLRGWAGQGRAGSVDMRELAQYGSRLAAGAATFGGSKSANMVKLGGLAQIATAGGASSAAEATESIAHLGTDVYKHKQAFKDAKIDAFDKDGRIVDPEELVKRSVLATKGNRGKLQELFGLQSIKAVSGAGNVFQDAHIKAKNSGASEKDATSAGEKAMNDAFAAFSKAALTEQQVREDAAKRLEDTDKKIEASMNRIRDKIGNVFLPIFEKWLGKLEKSLPELDRFIDKLASVVEWLATNPFKAILALIAGSVAKDVAAAGIGRLIASAVTNLMKQGGGGVSTVGVGGAAGKLGAAAAIATTAVVAEQLGEAGIDAYFGNRKANDASRISGDISAANAGVSAMGMGGASKDDLEKKKGALEAARKAMAESVAAQQANIEDNNGVMSFDRNMREITSFFGSDAGKVKQDAEKRALEQSKKELDRMNAALEAVSKSLEGFATTASNADPKNPKNRDPMSSPERH